MKVWKIQFKSKEKKNLIFNSHIKIDSNIIMNINSSLITIIIKNHINVCETRIVDINIYNHIKTNKNSKKLKLPLNTKSLCSHPKYKILLPLFITYCKKQSSRIRGCKRWENTPIFGKICDQGSNLCD